MNSWNWKNWTMFGMLIALFAGAGTGVIYGVMTHTEPGLTTPENSWGTIPLLVSCEDRSETDACNVVWDVVDVINSRLGFQMLSENGDVGGHIHIQVRAPIEVGQAYRDSLGGHFELTGFGTRYHHCDAWTNASGGASDIEWLTVYHELGHCLGLAHDDFEMSIMRPVQSATPLRTIPPWISDWDRELLRGKYKE